MDVLFTQMSVPMGCPPNRHDTKEVYVFYMNFLNNKLCLLVRLLSYFEKAIIPLPRPVQTDSVNISR